MKTIKNPPHASTLMNSIRSIGYTFESAISDILDNSISAQAQNIHVIFPASPECIVLGIYDDGIGMNEVELCEAMRYGSHIPNRSAHDLGRFGLGLKTASLSQCRHLAVVSKRNNKLHAFAWDLDKVQEENDWTLLELSHNEIYKLPHLEYLGAHRDPIDKWMDTKEIQGHRIGLYKKFNKDEVGAWVKSGKSGE